MCRKELIYQLCRVLEARARQQRESMRLAVPGLGPTCVPYEFWSSVSCSRVEVMETSVRPSAVEGRIRSGAVAVLWGDFARAVGILKYLDRKGKGLIDRTGFQAMPNRFERSRLEQAAVRDALHRVTVLVRHGRLTNLKGGPFRDKGSRTDLSRWIEGAADYPEETTLLVPLRKILRIASDLRRFEHGVFVRALNAHLLVFPTVFAPVDEKVVSLFAQHLDVNPGEEVLDVGTGTGVLAFIAARRGARVVATDCNAEAVRNARLNARRLGLENAVEVLAPSRMFEGLGDRKFDAVLFNAPWLKGKPRTTYEASIYDEGQVIEAFTGGVSAHLKPEGRIWLIYADVFQRTGQEALARVASLLEGNGLEIRRQWSAVRTGRVSGRGEKVVLYEITRAAPSAAAGRGGDHTSS